MNPQSILNQVDHDFLAAIQAGSDLSELPIQDWQSYAAGFAQRHALPKSDPLSLSSEPVATSVSEEKGSPAHNWRPITTETDRSVADFQGFVTGIVLEPGTPEDRDLHGNYMSAEEIHKAFLHWSVNFQRIDIMHDPSTEAGAFDHPDFRCVANWIEYGCPIIGGYQVKPGTWLQSYQAMNEQARQALLNNQINGLSPSGLTTFWRDPEPTSEA